MSRLGRWLTRRKRMMKDLDQDIRDYIERETQDNIERGMPPKEARYAALRKFGSVTRVKEDIWDVWTFGWLEQLGQDIRYGLRMLAKSPGFTAVAVLTLALGIGANTALFSVVNGVLLSPLPFPQPQQLVTLDESKPNFDRGSVSYLNFLDWQRDNCSFSAVAAYRGFGFNITGPGRPEQVSAELVTSGLFPLLGVKPVIGRTFAPNDDLVNAGPVAMISEGYWQRKFASAPDVVGKTLTLDGKATR